MAMVTTYLYSFPRKRHIACLLLLISIFLINDLRPKKPSGSLAIISLKRDGYDAKTGKWINKKPSLFSFAITKTIYEQVKNFYATDSGNNNPDHLQVMIPRDGYTYIYTPYKDPAHPYVTGMSGGGEEGYKGYWYADDLTKAMDSTSPTGSNIVVTPPKDESPARLAFGGYDARTGNWVNTSPSLESFTVSSMTYRRVKNWFATSYGTINPLNLPVEAPREDYTYIYVPFKDPKHPGVMGMSFQGDGVYKGYWYADKIGVTNDTIGYHPQIQAATPPPPDNSPPPTSAPKQDN